MKRTAGYLLPLLLLGVSSSTSFAGPAEQLLRLVPDDVGFCLVIRGLRDQSDALARSELVRRLQDSPIGVLVKGTPEVEKLRTFSATVGQLVGLDLTQIWEEVFGDALVFAYRPGEPGGHKKEEGLAMVMARQPQALARLVAGLNKAQLASGELLQIEPCNHAGTVYYRRTEKEREGYYYLNGALLAYSSQESMIKRVIDRERREKADSPRVLGSIQSLELSNHLAVLWVNPRALQPELEWNLAHSEGRKSEQLGAFLRYWKALDAAALSVRLDENLEFALSIAVIDGGLPEPARRLLKTASMGSTLWNRFPSEAILRVAARVDVSALADVIGDLLPAEDRTNARAAVERTIGAVLGKDVWQEVLPGIGPELGLCIIPPSAGTDQWVPRVMLAVALQMADQTPPLPQAIAELVHSFAMLGVLGYNQDHVESVALRTENRGDAVIRYATSPAAKRVGIEPGFGLVPGFLVLASTPDMLGRLTPNSRGDTHPMEQIEVPILQLSVRALRNYLSTHQDSICTYLSQLHSTPQGEVRQRLEAVLQVLSMVNQVALVQSGRAGQCRITLRLEPTWSLR